MPRRLGLLVVVAVAMCSLLGGCGNRSELPQDVGLDRQDPFTANASGALYDARTLHDEDDAPDLAYLTEDLPLRVSVAAKTNAGVARVTTSVDGRVVAIAHPRCGSPPSGADGCPRRVTVTTTPAVVERGAGEHVVEVNAESRDGRAAAEVTGFSVNVADAPVSVRDVEPRTARASGAAPALVTVDRTMPDPVVASVVRTAARGTLAPVLGHSRAVVRETGGGRSLVTALVDVVPARSAVSAVLPQLDVGDRARMTAARLADLVVDVDVRRRRVVGVEPGPGSQVTSWSLGTASAGEDERISSAFTPRRVPRLLSLSDFGPGFLSEDGDPTLRGSARDWPVSMVFTGNATVAKVKAGLRALGLTRRGHPRYLGYRTAGGIIRFDGDRGLKTACDQTATDVHARLSAPTATDSFLDPKLGHVVVATLHLDHRDGCGVGPQLFGFSERAERLLGNSIAAGLGWRVTADQYPLGNAEPLRRDVADPTHVWLSDGFATGVVVP